MVGLSILAAVNPPVTNAKSLSPSRLMHRCRSPKLAEFATMPLTHQELCSLAVNWLQRAPGRSGPACQVAFSEAKGGWNGEIPDAIGFRTAAGDEGSVVVEVKVSRSDYLADRLKAHRQDGSMGMGLYRYFMAPEGIIDVQELPQRWGLVEVSPKGVLRVRSGHVTVQPSRPTSLAT
jgi:hypothetical protein